MKVKHIFSCDWGTSNCRIYLVNLEQAEIIDQISNPTGILSHFQSWEKQDKEERLTFYLNFLKEQIQRLRDKVAIPLGNIPVVISGMASSSIGLQELPYAKLPFHLSANTEVYQKIEPSTNFPYPTLLISGIRSGNDVMRGEETQVIGWYHNLFNGKNDRQLLILPGTHSKHIAIDQGRITDFNTYMTGEFYAMLREHSILKSTVSAIADKVNPLVNKDLNTFFRKGVIDSQAGILTNLTFQIRAKHLHQTMTAIQANVYLSGLLIGHELKQLPNKTRLILMANSTLGANYKLALETLGRTDHLKIIPPEISEHLAVYGHIAIFKQVMD